MARVTLEEFLRRSNERHGGIYDYSRVDFKNTSAKVEIICSKHGPFWQTPTKHMAGAGCPNKECVVARRQATMTDRYGAPNALQSSEILQEMRRGMIAKYGAANPMQVDSFRKKHRETCRERFGTDTPLESPVVRDKIIAAMESRHGGRGAMCDAEVRSKSAVTKSERHGVADVQLQVPKANIGNLTNRVPVLDQLYQMLCDRFGDADVVRQYVSALYPHGCDFYIRSRDMYIELNASWTHGGGWFDDRADDTLLRKLQLRAGMSEYYAAALRTWTVLDVAKRRDAQHAGLNYLTFWDSDLQDAKRWFEQGCPDGRDYLLIRSWEQESWGDLHNGGESCEN